MNCHFGFSFMVTLQTRKSINAISVFMYSSANHFRSFGLSKNRFYEMTFKYRHTLLRKVNHFPSVSHQLLMRSVQYFCHYYIKLYFSKNKLLMAKVVFHNIESTENRLYRLITLIFIVFFVIYVIVNTVNIFLLYMSLYSDFDVVV